MQVIPRDGSGPAVVTTVADVAPGSQLRIRVADGSVTAAAMAVERAPGSEASDTTRANTPTNTEEE